MTEPEPTIIRAAILPLLRPADGDWPRLDRALKQVWMDATALANWGMTELAKHDRLRRPTDTKLPPMKRLDLYNLGFTRKRFYGFAAWKLCTQSAATILRRIEKAYRKARLAIVWKGTQVLPTFRYPHPYPVHNARWTATVKDGQPIVELNLAGEKHLLFLKRGKEFSRHLALFEQIAAGKVKQGELVIYRQGSQGHIMIKMIGHFPAPRAKQGHTLLVRSCPESLWICEREGRREWVLNADHLRRGIAAHRDWTQRLREDMKAERRSGQRPDRNIRQSLKLRCENQNNRLDSFTHEASAMLVRFAVRQGAATVIYDDRCQEYLPSFPWHSLRTKLGYKLMAAGITLVHRDGSTLEANECPIAEAAELVRMVERASKRGASALPPGGSIPPLNSNGSASRRPRIR